MSSNQHPLDWEFNGNNTLDSVIDRNIINTPPLKMITDGWGTTNTDPLILRVRTR